MMDGARVLPFFLSLLRVSFCFVSLTLTLSRRFFEYLIVLFFP